MDLEHIYKHIYNASVSCLPDDCYPIAYINICVGKHFPYTDEQIDEAFRKFRWDSAISSADLNIIRSESMDDFSLEVTSLNEFLDDSGEGKTYFPKKDVATMTIKKSEK